jgi:hypothetical protein
MAKRRLHSNLNGLTTAQIKFKGLAPKDNQNAPAATRQSTTILNLDDSQSCNHRRGLTAMEQPTKQPTASSEEDDKGEVGRMANFPKIVVRTEKKDGSIKHSFPFLEKKTQDEREYELFKQLAIEEPWSASNKGTAWENVVKNLRSIEKGDRTNLFPHVSVHTIKSRFMKVCQHMKEFMNGALFRSGTDDEVTNDFVDLVEQVLQSYYESQDTAISNKKRVNDRRDADRKDAETLRRVSMGDSSREEIQSLRPTPAKRSKVPLGLSDVGSALSHTDSLLSSFANLKREQMELEKQQLEVEKQRIALEEKRIAESKKEREQTMSVMARMVEMLGAVSPTNPNPPAQAFSHYPPPVAHMQRQPDPQPWAPRGVGENNSDEESK